VTAIPLLEAKPCSAARNVTPQFGFDFDPLCVVWADEFSDETAFRVEVTYIGDPSVKASFVHFVAANETSFQFPLDESPQLSGPTFLSRHSANIRVSALRPSVESHVGGTFFNAQ
jgi:hypothetical protein